jgi:hypothetical protein
MEKLIVEAACDVLAARATGADESTYGTTA